MSELVKSGNGHGVDAELAKWRAEVDKRLAPPPKPTPVHLRNVPRLEDYPDHEPAADQVVRPCNMCKKPCLCNKGHIERAESGLDDLPVRVTIGLKGEVHMIPGLAYQGVLCRSCSAKARHDWKPSDPIPTDEPSDLTAAARAEAVRDSWRSVEELREIERRRMFNPSRYTNPGGKLGAEGIAWGKADRSP